MAPSRARAQRPLLVVHHVALHELARARVVAEPEGAVLAHHRVDRPHARDVVAPAGGAAGDRDHEQARGAQALERGVGDGGQLAVEWSACRRCR